MKVLLARADNGGCNFYRMAEPARVVSELDSQISLRLTKHIDVDAAKDRLGHVTVNEIKEDIDLLIVQRPLHQQMNALINQAKRQGIAVVVELDDDLERLETRNRAWSHVQPENNPLENYVWLKKSAREADLITVSTIALSRFNHRNSVVIPNFVPESIFDLQKNTDPRAHPNVGWTGTVQTHPGDLESARGKIAQAVYDNDASFYVVGDGNDVPQALGLASSTPFSVSGWMPLEEYYQTILDNVDIGVVPLAKNDFNNAKSRLKGLEMAALGIPFVATDAPDYARLAAAGVGELSARPVEFYRRLTRWLSDEDRRIADGAKYRDIVQEHFTYEQNAHRWLNAWEQAISIRKKASK